MSPIEQFEAADDAWKELQSTKERLRKVCQTLIEEIGSVGPENAEDAAVRAVQEIRRLKGSTGQT